LDANTIKKMMIELFLRKILELILGCFILHILKMLTIKVNQ